MTKQSWFFCIVVFLLVTLTGCTTTQTFRANPGLKNLPQVEKIPLRAGIYYDTEFVNYKYIHYFGSARSISPVGKDSIAVFDKIFPMLFESYSLAESHRPYTA